MKRKIKSKTNRPRLRIFRSNKHIYAQVIDDIQHTTLITSSSLCPKLKKKIESSATCETAKIVGKDIGFKLKNKGITQIIFDRGKRIYHGRVKALADATRNEGINF
uniref:Large ribosomal subunit protein uL18c n=1 Tax=Calliarthron tuberculosum TaxID=48942 RepID=M4ITM9_CALTB|nr:50S ribosomal protein L18 [Calliarthron tuberculosum]AGA63825.1 50S ribosomal protein L18 [Calliarthron tuberculosum]